VVAVSGKKEPKSQRVWGEREKNWRARGVNNHPLQYWLEDESSQEEAIGTLLTRRYRRVKGKKGIGKKSDLVGGLHGRKGLAMGSGESLRRAEKR